MNILNCVDYMTGHPAFKLWCQYKCSFQVNEMEKSPFVNLNNVYKGHEIVNLYRTEKVFPSKRYVQLEKFM